MNKVIRIGGLFGAVLVAAGAIAVAVLLPFSVPDWSRWLFVAFAAAVGLAIAVGLYRRLPPNIRGAKTKRGVGAVSVVVLAAAAAVVAVLYPDLPGWARWMLIFGAVLLMLIGRLWRQAAWPDVAVAALVAVGIFAAVVEGVTEPAAPKPTQEVTFALPKELVTVLESVAKDGKAVLLVVEAAKVADDAPISYESTRYEATVPSALTLGDPSDDVKVRIERGAKDSDATAFSAAFAGATKIYVLSGGE